MGPVVNPVAFPVKVTEPLGVIVALDGVTVAVTWFEWGRLFPPQLKSNATTTVASKGRRRRDLMVFPRRRQTSLEFKLRQ